MVPDSDFELVMIISIISQTVKLDHVRLADPDDVNPNEKEKRKNEKREKFYNYITDY